MTQYRIMKMIEVGPGTTVVLTPEQAAPRAHRLEALGEDRYRTKDLMQFKAGEVVGLVEYVLPKAHENRVELVNGAEDGAEEPAAADLLEREPAAAKPVGVSGFRRRRR